MVALSASALASASPHAGHGSCEDGCCCATSQPSSSVVVSPQTTKQTPGLPPVHDATLNCSLTYAVDARQWVADGGDVAVLRSVVDEAMQLWETATGWEFELVSFPATPQVNREVNWASWGAGVDIPILTMAGEDRGVMWRTFDSPVVAGSAGVGHGVAIRSRPDLPVRQLRNVIIHEVGHVLGLTHDDEPAAVMGGFLPTGVDLAQLMQEVSVQVPDSLLNSLYCQPFDHPLQVAPDPSVVSMDVSDFQWDTASVDAALVSLQWHDGGVLVDAEITVNDGVEVFGVVGNEVAPLNAVISSSPEPTKDGKAKKFTGKKKGNKAPRGRAFAVRAGALGAGTITP